MLKKFMAIAALIILIIAFAACTPDVAQINGTADITYIIGEATPDYLSGVSAKRGDKDVTSEITVDSSDVDLQTHGTYKVIYSVPNGKKTPTTVEVNVNVNNPPDAIISGVKTIIYFLGDEEPDYLASVTATRNGIDVTDEINVNDDDVDLTTVGEYTVIYTVENAETDTTEEANVRVYEKSQYISALIAEADYSDVLTHNIRAGFNLKIEQVTVPLSLDFGNEDMELNRIEEEETFLEINLIDLSLDFYAQFSQNTAQFYASLNVSTGMIYTIKNEQKTPLFCLDGHFIVAVKDGYLYIDSLWEIIDFNNTRTNLSTAVMQYLIKADLPLETQMVLLQLSRLFAPYKEKIEFSFEEGIFDSALEQINLYLSEIPNFITPELFEGTIFDFAATENTVTATFEGSLEDIWEEYQLPSELSVLSDIEIVVAFEDNKFDSINASSKVDLNIMILEVTVVLDVNVDVFPQLGDDEEYELKDTFTIIEIINSIDEFIQ